MIWNRRRRGRRRRQWELSSSHLAVRAVVYGVVACQESRLPVSGSKSTTDSRDCLMHHWPDHRRSRVQPGEAVSEACAASKSQRGSMVVNPAVIVAQRLGRRYDRHHRLLLARCLPAAACQTSNNCAVKPFLTSPDCKAARNQIATRSLPSRDFWPGPCEVNKESKRPQRSCPSPTAKALMRHSHANRVCLKLPMPRVTSHRVERRLCQTAQRLVRRACDLQCQAVGSLR